MENLVTDIINTLLTVLPAGTAIPLHEPFFYGNEKKYLEALAKVPVVSKEQVRSIMSFLQGMTQLITEIALKKVEQTELNKALKESEERFQLLFNKAPLGYQSLDFDGNFLEVNQQWL